MKSFLSPLLQSGGSSLVLTNTRHGRIVARTLLTAFDSKSRKKGLLGRDSLPEGSALIIAPCQGIHTFSMRFAIDVAFVAKDGRCSRCARRYHPGASLCPCAPLRSSSCRPGRSTERHQAGRQAADEWRSAAEKSGPSQTNRLPRVRQSPRPSRRPSILRPFTRKFRKPHRSIYPATSAWPLLIWGVADRRRDKRFRLTEPAEGTVRLFPDVIVQQDGDEEWIGIGRQPAVAGETLMLERPAIDTDEGELRHRLPVCVIESRPMIVDGDMRHRIRLHSGMMASVRFEQQMRRG